MLVDLYTWGALAVQTTSGQRLIVSVQTVKAAQKPQTFDIVVSGQTRHWKLVLRAGQRISMLQFPCSKLTPNPQLKVSWTSSGKPQIKILRITVKHQTSQKP